MSFTDILEKTGPKIEPWGTPKFLKFLASCCILLIESTKLVSAYIKFRLNRYDKNRWKFASYYKIYLHCNHLALKKICKKLNFPGSDANNL